MAGEAAKQAVKLRNPQPSSQSRRPPEGSQRRMVSWELLRLLLEVGWSTRSWWAVRPTLAPAPDRQWYMASIQKTGPGTDA